MVGLHEAPVPQLLIVIRGEGWVCGEDGNSVDIQTGDIVLWIQGQVHESVQYKRINSTCYSGQTN